MVVKVKRSGVMAALVAAVMGFGLPGVLAGQAEAAEPAQGLLAPDERIGKDIHSISPGNLNDPGFGAAVASKFFPNQKRVFVAGHSDSAWPDALSAGPVAGKAGKPVFLTTADHALPSPDAAYVAKHTNEITILGGTKAVSAEFEANWRAQGKTVHRIAGSNRFETAAIIARQQWPSGADTVILARGDNPADAISGQPLGAKLNAPILLTEPNRLPTETVIALKAMKPKRIIVLGGHEGISPTVMYQATQTSPGAGANRVAGATRFETSKMIASTYFPEQRTIFAGLNHTPGDGTTMETGSWAEMFQLAPAAGSQKAPLVLHPALHHYLATPIDYTVHAYDPGTKPGVAFYENDPLWGNVDLAWRETALIRAKHGLPTMKSCTGTFTSPWQGYGGPTNAGDGSVWVNGWSAAVFTTSPGHMDVLTTKGSNYIRIVAQTLRESHGDNYAQSKPGVGHLMDQRGLSIRVGTCEPNGKTAVPIEQKRLGPNTLSTP